MPVLVWRWGGGGGGGEVEVGNIRTDCKIFNTHMYSI